MAALAWLVTLALLVVPLAITPGRFDVYRLIKEFLLRAEGIVAGVLLVTALAFSWSTETVRAFRASATVRIAAAGVAWTIVTTIASTNRLLSVETLVSITCAALVAVAAWYAASRIGLVAIDMIAVAGIANTIIAALQEYGIWQPIAMRAEIQGHLKTTAFIGNPNEVGSYLALAAVVLIAAWTRVREIRRLLYPIAFLICIAGIVISETRTALLALAAGGIVAAARWSRRAAVVAVVLVVISIGVGSALEVRAVKRLLSTPREAMEGRWGVALSERGPAFLAAVEMFRDRPLIGMGAGTYGFHYMPYRLRVMDDYPQAISSGAAVNFGETHNDHLQILAEGGVVGYAIFVAALVALARIPRPRTDVGDPRPAVANTVALPIAATLFVLALGQFPLQVASMQHLIITVAALADGWRERS